MGGIDNTTKYATHNGNCITALYKDNCYRANAWGNLTTILLKQFLGMGEGTGILLVLEPLILETINKLIPFALHLEGSGN